MKNEEQEKPVGGDQALLAKKYEKTVEHNQKLQ